MHTRYAQLALTILLLLVTAAAVGTDSFRCGTHVISEGLAQRKVLQYCGEPTEKRGDEWVYDWGPERQVMVVVFDPEQKVDRIHTE